MTAAYAVSPRAAYTRFRRDKDPRYLAWIRRQPCIVKGCKSRYQEAAHTGPRGLSTKADDRDALPICPFHHQTGNQSYHRLGRRRFEAVHRLDIAGLILEFNEWFDRENAA